VELPSADDLVNQAVTVLIRSMGEEAWSTTRSAFAKFFGKGRSTSSGEGDKLDNYRESWQSAAEGERPAVEQKLADMWRDRLTDLVAWRPDALAELQHLLQSLAPSSKHTQAQISVTASDTSVVQVAGGDLTVGDQPITLKSRGKRSTSKDPR
jgi:hypothetical protein